MGLLTWLIIYSYSLFRVLIPMGMYTMKPPIQTVVACGGKIVEIMAVGYME